MSTLNTQANFHDSGSSVRGDFEPGDAFYEALMDAHHWLILHGRYVCQARKPLCWQCAVSAHCDFKPKTKQTL